MLKNAWSEYASTNASHVANPNLFWESDKAFLRGRITSFVVAYKKTTQKKYYEASALERAAQSRLNERHTPANLKAWQETKHIFDIWANNLEHIKSSHIQLQYHKHRNKARKLARLSKVMYHPTHVTSLKNFDGTLSSSPKEINKTIEIFYTSLYADYPFDAEEAIKWLESVALPKIDPDYLNIFNSLKEEILLAIRKSPRPRR